MAVTKSFIVRNGLEVSANLLVANDTTKKVGILTGAPNYSLHVNGGIGATSVFVTGVSTFKGNIYANSTVYVGSGVTLTTSSVLAGTLTGSSYTVDGTQIVSSARELQNIASLDAITTATIENAIINAPNTFTDLYVSGISTLTNLQGTNISYSGISTLTNLQSTNSTLTTLSGTNISYSGISTFGNVKISAGIITASNAGIVTYYGDGQYIRNVTRGIGIQTAGSGGPIGYGATVLDFRGSGISTITVGSGIGTINITGGVSIAVTSVAPTSKSLGSLWYNINLAKIFIWYDELPLGIGNTAYWIDSAPFNVGTITSLTNVAFSSGTALSPSISFTGDSSTGFFRPDYGQTTIVSVGASILNINPNGIIVSGITTAIDFDSTSDISLKKDIEEIDNPLEIINALHGVKFTWKSDDKKTIGVVAQEVEKILPELVGKGNPKTVNYNGLIGVLIEAVKELSSEVEELKFKLNK